MAAYLHYMKLHTGDWLRDTQHLDATATGAYLLLVMHCFTHGSLPLDENELRRIARCTLHDWRKNVELFLPLFFRSEHGYCHKRIDAERAHAKDLYEKRKSLGKQGAAKRWGIAIAINQNDAKHSNSYPQTYNNENGKRDSNQHQHQNKKESTQTPPPVSGTKHTPAAPRPRPHAAREAPAGADVEHMNGMEVAGSPRDNKTNPRALGNNPRALGTNPRTMNGHPPSKPRRSSNVAFEMLAELRGQTHAASLTAGSGVVPGTGNPDGHEDDP